MQTGSLQGVQPKGVKFQEFIIKGESRVHLLVAKDLLLDYQFCIKYIKYNLRGNAGGP